MNTRAVSIWKSLFQAALAEIATVFGRVATPQKPQTVRQPTFYGKAHRFSGVAAARRAAKKRRASRR